MKSLEELEELVEKARKEKEKGEICMNPSSRYFGAHVASELLTSLFAQQIYELSKYMKQKGLPSVN